MVVIGGIVVSIVILVGGTLVMNNEMTLGLLIAAIMLSGRLFIPIDNGTRVGVWLGISQATGHRVFEVIENIPIIMDNPDAINLPEDGKGEISFEDVSFGYREEPVLEKITLKIFAGITISFLGVIIISTIGNPEMKIEIKYMSGVLGVIVAAIVAAGYTVLGKKLLKRYSALSLTVYAMLLGCIGLIPFIRISLFQELAKMSIMGWFAVIFLALFPTVISYILWYVALEIKKASEISIYLYFIPVLSTLISYVWLDEKITPFFLLGGLMVILGLFIVNKQQEDKNKRYNFHNNV